MKEYSASQGATSLKAIVAMMSYLDVIDRTDVSCIRSEALLCDCRSGIKRRIEDEECFFEFKSRYKE